MIGGKQKDCSEAVEKAIVEESMALYFFINKNICLI